MFYVLCAHVLLFHWSIYHMRTYWFHGRVYSLENTCAFLQTCVRTYSLLHAHVNKYVKRAHVFENNAHVSSMPPWNGLNLTIKPYESISCKVFKPIILHTVTTHSKYVLFMDKYSGSHLMCNQSSLTKSFSKSVCLKSHLVNYFISYYYRCHRPTEITLNAKCAVLLHRTHTL